MKNRTKQIINVYKSYKWKTEYKCINKRKENKPTEKKTITHRNKSVGSKPCLQGFGASEMFVRADSRPVSLFIFCFYLWFSYFNASFGLCFIYGWDILMICLFFCLFVVCCRKRRFLCGCVLFTLFMVLFYLSLCIWYLFYLSIYVIFINSCFVCIFLNQLFMFYLLIFFSFFSLSIQLYI